MPQENKVQQVKVPLASEQDSDNAATEEDVAEMFDRSESRRGLQDVFLCAFVLGVLALVIGLGRIVELAPRSSGLSWETESILAELEGPVVLRFYVSDSPDYMDRAERQVVEKVDRMLQRYGKLGGKQVRYRKNGIRPFSVDADQAREKGVDPIQGRYGEIYAAIEIQCIEQREVIQIGVLSKERARALEYEITTAIVRIGMGEEQMRKVKLMTTLNVDGTAGPAVNEPPWQVFQELRRTLEVELVGDFEERVDPEDTNVLVVLHPSDLSEVAQYRIDQYLLAGGTVVICVDPFYSTGQVMNRTAQRSGQFQPFQQMRGTVPLSSDLPVLFNAWGIDFEAEAIVADMKYGHPQSPVVLILSEAAMSRSHELTKELSQVMCFMAGGIRVSLSDRFEIQSLISTSDRIQLLEASEVDPSGRIQRNGKVETVGKEQAVLVEMNGRFQTAFPDGSPLPENNETQLVQSAQDGRVIIMGDVDFLTNSAGSRSRDNFRLALRLFEFASEDRRWSRLRSRVIEPEMPNFFVRRIQSYYGKEKAQINERILSLEEDFEEKARVYSQERSRLAENMIKGNSRKVDEEAAKQLDTKFRLLEKQLSEQKRNLSKQLSEESRKLAQLERREVRLSAIANLGALPILGVILFLALFLGRPLLRLIF